MAQQNRSSVAGPSTAMAWLSICGFFVLPACVIYAFLEPDNSRWLMMHFNHGGESMTGATPLEFRLAALACALVPTAFTMWALWSLRRLFLLYAAGSVFSHEALSALNQVAVALFASVIVSFISGAPITALLSWPNGPHHREISLSFGSDDVATLFIACTVLVIARVMAEAQRVADENAKFV